MAIEKDLLDQLLAGRDPKDVFQGGRIGGIPSAERLSPFGPRGIVSMLRSGACVDVLIPQPV